MSVKAGNGMKQVKFIAFDLDGTLCNTLGDIAASLNCALVRCGFPTFSDADVSALVGRSIDYMCRNAVPKVHEDDWTKVREGFWTDYAEHLCDTTRPYDGMPEALRALKNAGFTLAVVTNKPDPHANKMICTLFPEGLFKRVLGQSERYPVKPDAAMLDVVREGLGFSRNESLYVGDMDVDVQFAKNAGLPFIGCGWGFRGEAFLREAGAETVLSHPSELLKVFHITK